LQKLGQVKGFNNDKPWKSVHIHDNV